MRLYSFGYALLNPDKAPAVEMGAANAEPITRSEAFTWFLGRADCDYFRHRAAGQPRHCRQPSHGCVALFRHRQRRVPAHQCGPRMPGLNDRVAWSGSLGRGDRAADSHRCGWRRPAVRTAVRGRTDSIAGRQDCQCRAHRDRACHHPDPDHADPDHGARCVSHQFSKAADRRCAGSAGDDPRRYPAGQTRRPRRVRWSC